MVLCLKQLTFNIALQKSIQFILYVLLMRNNSNSQSHNATTSVAEPSMKEKVIDNFKKVCLRQVEVVINQVDRLKKINL